MIRAYRRHNEIGHQRESVQTLIEELQPNRLTMVCEAGKLREDWQLALIGNVPELGDWDPLRAIPMQQVSRGLWCVNIDRSTLNYPLRFKFVVLDRLTHHFIGWEDCTNRYSNAQLSNASSTLGTFSALAQNFNGMKTGFKFTRQ